MSVGANVPENILSLISKCLTLADHENTSVEEAAAAMSRVSHLMMKYNLEQQDIANAMGRESNSEIVVDYFHFSKNSQRVSWMANLCIGIGRGHMCRVILAQKGQVILVGEIMNVEAVKMLYKYLSSEIMRLEENSFVDYFATTPYPMHHTAYRNDFCHAAVSIINERISEQTKVEKASNNKVVGLMVVQGKLVDQKVAATFPKLGNTRMGGGRAASDGANAGYVAGRSIPLRPGALQLT